MFISSNIIYELLLLKETCIFLCLEKHNVCQYSFVTVHYFWIFIINATVVQLISSERKCKLKITIKMHLPTTITQCWNPLVKSWKWINVGNVYNLSNRSYPYFYFNTLYKSLHDGFPFSYTRFIATSWEN